MRNKVNIEKLSRFVSKESPAWMEQAEFYEHNKDWLDKSALIAIKILSALKNQSITQKALAESISVTPQYINKVVKGQENLTLETICKIEKSLGISLISVPSYESSQVILDDFSILPFSIPKFESKPIGSKKTEYTSESEYQPQDRHIAA